MHWADGVFAVLQVKYKEGFDKNLKGQRPRYNPLECLSFKHIQAAAALASQVWDPLLSYLPISPTIPPPKRLCGVAMATLRQIKKVVWMGAAEDEEHTQYQIHPVLCSSLHRCDYSFIYIYILTLRTTHAHIRARMHACAHPLPTQPLSQYYVTACCVKRWLLLKASRCGRDAH